MTRGSNPTPRREEVEDLGRLSLLIIVDNTFVTHPLPPSGEVTIGRGRHSDIRIDHTSISRGHAVLRLGPPMSVEDLGSANGTRVRQAWLEPGVASPVSPGEVIDIGGAMAIIQQRTTRPRPRRVWTHGYFEMRLDEECARAERTSEKFALVRLQCPVEKAAVVEGALADALRTQDVIGNYVPGEYEALLVDVTREQAQQIVSRVHARLNENDITVKSGLAFYPDDGRDPASLVSAAAQAIHGHPAATDAAMITSAMHDLERLIERVAVSQISVLILGETGVGKESMAETVHRLSPRASKPFVRLNCAALSETLLESELFGHERGAFTGAVQAKPGLLETADGGTVFLDEVGDLPLATQVKLLRVLEEREVLRVGAVKPRTIDVRFVAATNRDVEADVERGVFRSDLYFRLNGISVVIPPLRERVGEIEPLAKAFIAEVCRLNGRTKHPSMSADALELLLRYSWPGNIRELRNVIERAVILCGGSTIRVEHLPVEKIDTRASRRRDKKVTAAELKRELFELERQRVMDALGRCSGNQKETAKLLGISRRTLNNWLDLYRIPGPRKKRRGIVR